MYRIKSDTYHMAPWLYSSIKKVQPLQHPVVWNVWYRHAYNWYIKFI